MILKVSFLLLKKYYTRKVYYFKSFDYKIHVSSIRFNMETSLNKI